jgi:hypothetical protein
MTGRPESSTMISWPHSAKKLSHIVRWGYAFITRRSALVMCLHSPISLYLTSKIQKEQFWEFFQNSHSLRFDSFRMQHIYQKPLCFGRESDRKKDKIRPRVAPHLTKIFESSQNQSPSGLFSTYVMRSEIELVAERRIGAQKMQQTLSLRRWVWNRDNSRNDKKRSRIQMYIPLIRITSWSRPRWRKSRQKQKTEPWHLKEIDIALPDRKRGVLVCDNAVMEIATVKLRFWWSFSSETDCQKVIWPGQKTL